MPVPEKNARQRWAIAEGYIRRAVDSYQFWITTQRHWLALAGVIIACAEELKTRRMRWRK